MATFTSPCDGGNANDVSVSQIEPGGNAQNPTTPMGKMLRFDPPLPTFTPASPDSVSHNGQYRIPLSNPFQNPGQVPETYAYGLRNPYRFSFDRVTGDLILADVEQNNIGARMRHDEKRRDYHGSITPSGASLALGYYYVVPMELRYGSLHSHC